MRSMGRNGDSMDEGANFWPYFQAVGDGNPHEQWKSAGRRACFQAWNRNFHPQAPPALLIPALMALFWPGMKVPTFGHIFRPLAMETLTSSGKVQGDVLIYIYI